MSRLSRKSLIIHGLVFCMGLGGALVFSSPPASPSALAPSPRKERDQRPDRSEGSGGLTSPSSFRAAYSVLLERPMTGEERQQCMSEFWRQWGKTDPVGRLAFLEKKRVWPESLGSYMDFDLKDRPDLLLDFALRFGSSDALRDLGFCDPAAVSRLIAAIPEEERGADLVSLANQIDRKLGALGVDMQDPSPAFLRGVAEDFLKEGRLDEFFGTFGEVTDPKERRELAGELGKALSDEKRGEEVLALLLRLPEEYRDDAAYKLMQGGTIAMEFREVRDGHKRWIESLAAVGMAEAAASGMRSLFDDEKGENRGEEIAEWVARFPDDGSWQPITEALFRVWWDSDHDGLIPQICALPAGATRETLATEVAAATIGGRVEPDNEKEQMMYDRLAALFTNPEARKEFDERFAPEPERSEPSDPFAPDSDPFADEEQ
jgi:hypothetical protein